MTSSTLWYTCYIDLYRNQGMASSFVEQDGMVLISKHRAKEATTINELHLYALVDGLELIADGSDVHIIGMSKYITEVLKKIAVWVDKDELDLKAHSHLLRDLWQVMIKKGVMTTEYFTSRRSKSLLWLTSQYSKNVFRLAQFDSVENLKFPHLESWTFANPVDLEKFKFENPLTEHEMEKRIIQRRKELAEKEIKTTDKTNVLLFIRPAH